MEVTKGIVWILVGSGYQKRKLPSLAKVDRRKVHWRKGGEDEE